MSINLTELRRLNFADSMFRIIFPDAAEPANQTALLYEFLWKKIVDQELRSGDRVVDLAIAAEAGVSRTPVREAMQRLVQDGLLERLPRGVRVAVMTPAALIEIYDYRAALETFAARRAATRLSPEEIRRLLQDADVILHRLAVPGGEHDPLVTLDFMRQDLALHQILLRYGGNSYIARAMAALQARLSIFQVAGTRVPGRMMTSQREHNAILQAVRLRDADGAARAMGTHMEQVKRLVLAEYFGQESAEEDPERVALG